MKKTRYSHQAPYSPSAKPLLIVLSGPSGVGKDAVLARMRALDYHLKYITTVTTRQQRAKEKNDIDYHFISLERFQEMRLHNELLESANVYGNWYGIPKRPVKQALDRGEDTIVKIDIQGAATLKKILPQAVFIFLMPSSMAELTDRLKQRHTETPFDLALRIKTAEAEIKQISLFDYTVVNKQGAIDLAVAQIAAIITAEKCRTTPREVTL